MSRRPDDPRNETRTASGRRPEQRQEPDVQEESTAGAPGRHYDETARTGNGRNRPYTEEGRRPEAVAPAGEANGSGIAALVVGLLAVTLAFMIFPAIAAVLMGIAAVILGAVGVRNANRLAGMHKGLSITGIVTGALALVIGAAVIVGGAALVDRFQDQIQVEDIQQQLD